jgi:hypothetical protein
LHDSCQEETSIDEAARNQAERSVVRADEKLNAFLELQAAIHLRFEAQLESHA